jgi:hypothetical protein
MKGICSAGQGECCTVLVWTDWNEAEQPSSPVVSVHVENLFVRSPL